MWKALEGTAAQFAYEPEVLNAGVLPPFRRVIVAGMGGSRWPAGFIARWVPALPVATHHSYGIPTIASEDRESTFVIACSYSGNTEETVSAFAAALEAKVPVAAIASGGKLIEAAKAAGAPYVLLPNPGIQPRMATGYIVRGLLALMGQKEALAEMGALAGSLDVTAFEEAGKVLAARLANRVPVVYGSSANTALAYAWKIKLNETGKIPAFMNTFPELNHNEMNGFDAIPSTRPLADPFHFIFLRDVEDDPRIAKRMEVLEQLYRARGFRVDAIALEEGKGKYYKAFASLVLADWTAYHLAQAYGTEPEQVPMVEDFKKLIAS